MPRIALCDRGCFTHRGADVWQHGAEISAEPRFWDMATCLFIKSFVLLSNRATTDMFRLSMRESRIICLRWRSVRKIFAACSVILRGRKRLGKQKRSGSARNRTTKVLQIFVCKAFSLIASARFCMFDLCDGRSDVGLGGDFLQGAGASERTVYFF